MAWCLIKSEADKFRKALKDGTINPEAMATMSSIERRKFLEDFVGKENAKEVNALFEGKLLLKNQKAGYISWAKKVAGITPKVRQDLISKIERLDKVLSGAEEKTFLNDLASTRLRVDVTPEEAKNIAELYKKVSDTGEKMNPDFTFNSQTDRLSHGLAKVELEDYFQSLKRDAKKISLRETPVRAVAKAVSEAPGVAKSIVASLDNSFFGRQGIKVLYTKPGMWTKAFLKSWGDMGKELLGKDAIAAIKADIYSRPNALNGKYKAGGYGLDVLSEEAFPSSLPEKIPLFGRFFKASESAYNGAALRLRADLADSYIKLAEKNGVNTLNRQEAQAIGNMVGSLTGRGKVKLTEEQSQAVNKAFFSVKFLKSNFDTLTAHLLDKTATAFTKKESAKNLLRIVGAVSSILGIAKLLDPDSVDVDPRSTNFGKVKVFGQWTDVTGGMGGLVRLAARVSSGWSKSSTGKWTQLGNGFGSQSRLGAIYDFFEGKLSPVAGVVRDNLKGEMFGGEKFTWKKAIQNLTTPLSLTTFNELMNDPNSESVIGSMILEALGFSTNAGSQKKEYDWNNSTAKKYEQFKNKVGEKKFEEANIKFNEEYNQWLTKVVKTDQYKKLSEDGKEKLKKDAKEKIEQKVFKSYDYVYKTPEKTREERKESETIKKLIDLK